MAIIYTGVTLLRFAVPLALVLAAGNPGVARAELRIGSHTTQNTLTTVQHSGSIQADLQLITGMTVILAHNANNGRPYWVVTLGAALPTGAKPHGSGLVLSLINSAHITTIAVDGGLAIQGGGALAYCANGMTLSQLAPAACKVGGAGTDAVVAIASPSGLSSRTDANTPRYIIFAHELTHALHATVGQRHGTNATNEARTIGNYLGMVAVPAAALPPGIGVNENLLRGESTLNNGNPLNCRNPTNTAQYPAHGVGHPHC